MSVADPLSSPFFRDGLFTVFASILASIGLDSNVPNAIIGSMLISPLSTPLIDFIKLLTPTEITNYTEYYKTQWKTIGRSVLWYNDERKTPEKDRVKKLEKKLKEEKKEEKILKKERTNTASTIEKKI
jgi:hypothetical protein